ncbi:PREDICTED: CRIB domain-containing protein RIC5 [Ipomoea nil]|uniref:CRIB domain-containing protein RIC5 n=1 Tax=Ipomoea nil TaxID=35883 RepID=UPI000900BE44|nr:PREDICTED: CRIB domain-containing protein RIC5 [Ipomoea nil]XP_019165422.1 PREDICTED: CRIB domain-containing protein RIC5 [Ipomoea nil]
MSTKVKGLLKGIKYISHQIFEEEKEPEIQIGMPTDVKHVAHIGWDGPSATENPSWMNEFKGSGALKSAPLGPPTDSKENPEIKWVSEDSKGRRAPRPESRDGGAGGEGSSKPRRHSCSNDNTAGAAGGGGGGDSPKSSKPRQTRRSKASSDGVKIKDPTGADNPDVPKRNRRKKSRDFNADGSVRSTRTSKSSATAADQAQDTTTDTPPSSTSSKPLDDGENPVLF